MVLKYKPLLFGNVNFIHYNGLFLSEKQTPMQNNHNYPYSALNQQEAEHIATSALLYLVQDKELLGHFLSASGLGPHSIRKAAQDPDFLIGVLEYLMENETALLAYAKSQKLRPTMIVAAHYILAKKWNEQ